MDEGRNQDENEPKKGQNNEENTMFDVVWALIERFGAVQLNSNSD